MEWRAVIIAGLIVISGCGAAGSPSSTATPTDTPTTDADTVTRTPTPTATDTPVPTPTSTPELTATPLPAAAHNPWEKQEITVAISNTGEPDRNFEPLIESALEFWEQNATNTTDYEVEFDLVNDTSRADIVVSFVEDVGSCGPEREEAIGCAPVYEYVGQADAQSNVEIETGYDNESTVLILKHEFGHTLGLDHNDTEPTWFMDAKISVGTFPKPDVDERDWKWKAHTITVYADVDAAVETRRDKLREEVRMTVNRYNRYEHEYIPENASIQIVDNPEKADIVVKIVDETPSGDYSEVDIWGRDVDEDGSLEYYSEATIYIRDEYHDDVGQYAGYWMGYILYADSDSDLPGVYRPE